MNTNERKDDKAIHDLFSEFHYMDDLGVIKSKLAKYATTVRQEAQRDFLNNIAAVLDAEDIEAFTALVMKAKASPDLNSDTRSALKSEAEIRREERTSAFRDAVEIVDRLVCDPNYDGNWRNGYDHAQNDMQDALEAAANSVKNDEVEARYNDQNSN